MVYFAQFRAPWVHSWNNPRRSNKIKNILILIQINKLFKLVSKGIGIMMVISISKIRKITAMRKNRIEKGKRADPFGSKPHSKGDSFSRRRVVFLNNRVLAMIRIVGRIIASKVIRIIIFSLIRALWLEITYT